MSENTRPTYELMYVVNTVLNDDQVDDICDRVATYIRDNDGEVLEEERWGSRRLAYPIEKKRNGYYGLVFFQAAPDFIARLDRALRINDDILRHMVLRYDAKMLRHFDGRAERAKAAEPEASKDEDVAEPVAKAEAEPAVKSDPEPAVKAEAEPAVKSDPEPEAEVATATEESKED